MTFRQKLGKLVIPMLLCYWSNINMIKNQESKEIPCFAKWATGTCPALTCCHPTTLLSPRVHLADLQHVAHVLLCHDLFAPINKVLPGVSRSRRAALLVRRLPAAPKGGPEESVDCECLDVQRSGSGYGRDLNVFHYQWMKMLRFCY